MSEATTSTDLLLNGYIARTFSPTDAHNYFATLFHNPNFLQHYHISYAQGAWFALNMPSPSPGPSSQVLFRPLDCNTNLTQGTVVPQRRWTPSDEFDIRRHVVEATLHLPIFFFRLSGQVGFCLQDILQGHDRDLYSRDGEVPLEGRATTHIRINVSSQSYTRYDDFIYIFFDSSHSGQNAALGNARSPYETRPLRGI